MPEMTETQTSGRKPKKKKNKESHNAVERHRKEKINAGISRIGNLLPCSQALKQSKIMILDQAFRYITELKKQNDTMLLEGAEKTQASEIRRLRLQLEEMRKESAHYIQLLKAHDILEDPTVHWKGKQRCSKISNVTSQIQKGIIVYSNGKDLDSRAQPMETLVLQQQSEASSHLRVNGALVQVNTSSSSPSLLPSSAVTAPRAIEQCVVETPALASSLPPSVSYITLQIPAVTTALPQPQPAAAVQTLTIASTSASPLPSESAIVPVSSLTSLTPSIRAARSTTSLASLDPAIRTVAYTAVPNSQPFFRAQAAGSTQTTWTTLQMAGNTVQPVCQSISPPDDAQNVQQVTVCQPIQVQMQPSSSAQQTPCQIKSQLQPTILSQRQSVAPQNPCAVLSPSAIMSQPAVMAHTAVVSQPAVIQPAALVTHSPALLSQPPLVPQAQPAVLPLLQTMQVLQVKTANATAPGVTAPQSTNNQSVVILQQANNCPTQSVVREEITNSTPCQHIVIIQAPNPSAPTPQNASVSVVPPAVPSVPAASTSIPSTGSTSVTSPQTVGGKQLVHILPRPVQPQQNKCQPVSQSTTSTQAPTTPQTITVNGQVFALQPVKTSENLISNCGQTTLQLIQPTTTEEPTTNVALNSLGALSSLNQSISQGIPISISGQNNLSSSSIIQQQPTNATSGSESAVTLPIQRPCLKPIKPAIVAKSPKNAVRKSLPAKKIKKIKQVKNQEQKMKPPAVILAKTTPVTSASQILPNDLKNSTPEKVQSNSSSIGVTSTAVSYSITQSMNVTITQNTDPSSNVAISQNGISVSCHPSLPNDSAKTTNLLNKSNTTGLLTAVTDIPATVSVSSTVNEIKTSIPSENISTKNSTVVKMQKESSSIQNKIILASSEQKDSSCGISTQLRLTCPNSTSNVTTILNKPTLSSSVCIPQESLVLEPAPCSRPGPTASVSTTMPPFTNTLNLTPLPSSREKNNVSDVNCLIQRTCQPPEVKPAQSGRGNSQEGHNKTDKIHPITVNFDLDSKKDLTHNQQIYTNLDDQTPDSSLSLSRQTDSPLSSASGGRGFSVASMLPQGHNLSAASGSFSSFVLTSEQAEMLALAMLEQDSPDRKTAVCTGNKTGTSNPNTGTWEPTKPSSVSTAKDCGSVARQEKMNTSMDTLKTASCPPIRGQDEGTMGSRHTQNLSYSHSQTVLQTQNTMQNSTVASLSVNNLIRTSSSQPPYPGSPNMTSVPSPVCTTAHISQQSNAALSPCSASAQLTPLKSALLRSQAGLNMAERVKIIPKRQAQEEVIMNSGKRAKQCPLSGNTVNQMEVKGLDHSQLMGAQLPPISSSIMNRMNNESSGPLFTNTFMSPVVRPSETHCSAPGLPEQSQPGVLHVPQGHLQHHTPQTVPNLGGNHYMKQQQDQRHLYHLQQHLTQPDVLQHHSLHQRALQQQEQQQQHAQKKRGLVRGNQASSPAALQQKQQQAPPHHHQPSQHSSSQQHPSQHPQQHPQQQHQQQLQNSHSRHQQHLQQQLHQQHFRHQDKSCDAPVSRAHHSGHLPQLDHHKPAQDHNAMQRMMSSRSLEQTLISPPTNAPSRQERQRVSNYSAEALIGKSSTNDQRMSLHLQPGRGAAQEQPDLRGYLDSSRTKANITHNPLNRIPSEHSRPVEGQRVSMGAAHQLSSFEVQVSRGNEISVKSGPPAQRGPQGPQSGGFRTGAGPPADGRNRAVYNALPASQVQVGLVQDGCHQSFMQSLLSPHLPEQSVHNQVAQCCPPVSMEYCVPRSTSTDLQAKTSSSSVSQNQKAPGMRLGESNKGHISLGSNLHSGVRTALSHAPNSSAEAGRSSAPSRTPAAVAQHTRHITRDTQPSKLRAGDRTRSGTVRSTNPFESEGPLSLPSGGGVLLGRPQSGAEARRSTIVRFMPDTAQGPAGNNLVPDQHLTQNFGFPFIPEGGMNPPPAINANATFIPPVSQQNASRTPSLLPVEAQNTLPSFYPSYSPAAHPSLPSDVTLQYFPNQMFTSPSADKSSAPPLNNRFGSILSPPRPVGFAQTSFPLLTDMTPMPIANSSGITPHISNFSLTSLFPEIATGMPSDGSAMPMSPLLSLSNTSSDAGKQPNRPAHNISHILGHDGSSAV